VIETMIETVAGAAITLQQPLAQAYAVQTVAVYGNVVAATHGESKGEVLGSGNGALLFQKFELKNKPLTYIPAAAEPSGSQTTLQVRVNAVLWEEAPAFYGRGPRDRIYTTQRADDGTVTVQFGDGLAGARLPSGVENVTAGYRVGSGAAGLLQPSQLSLLLTRPLGVRSVTNPLASLNAVDPESGAAIRFNAPLTVLTFDRIVSLQDFERFAGAYAGVAKVQALALRNGEEQIVYLSVAGANNTLIDAANPLSARLASAMQAAGAPARSFRLLPHSARTFGLQARIVLLPGHRPEDVQSRLAGSLAAAFSFAQRSLGQPVTRSELIAAMQAVEGVAAVALDSMFLAPAATAYLERLPAQPIRRTQAGIVGAELLTIDMAQVTLTVAPGLSA
jgi:predicted phage baseplate assembly protein